MGKLGGLKRLNRLGRCNFFTRKVTSFISFQLLSHSIELSVPFMPIWSSLWSSCSSKTVGSPGTCRSGKADARTESISRYGGEQADVKLRPIVVSHREYEFRIPFRVGFSLLLYVCYFNPVQLTLSLSPSSTNNPQHFTHVSPAPHPSHRVYAPQSFECRSIRNLWRPNRDGAEHDIMRKKMNCHSFLPIVKRKSPSPGMRNDVQFMRFQQSHLGPISSFLRCLNIK